MEVVYFLVVLAIAVTGLIAWAFIWSVRSGQFEDLEGPAHRILHDDDRSSPRNTPTSPEG
jgi:cbb3-type cytochrome oxidase maturation protein